jgi:hypothetical protein
MIPRDPQGLFNPELDAEDETWQPPTSPTIPLPPSDWWRD